MIDEPQLPVPASRFGLRAVRSTFVTKRVEPHDRRGELGAPGAGPATGSKVTRARQVVEREVQPGARLDQVLDLRRPARCAPSTGVELDQHDLRHRAGRARARSRRRRAPRPAPCAPCPAPRNFSTYSPSSSRLDDGRQRAALAQRRHVARGGDGPHPRHVSALSRSGRRRGPVAGATGAPNVQLPRLPRAPGRRRTACDPSPTSRRRRRDGARLRRRSRPRARGRDRRRHPRRGGSGRRGGLPRPDRRRSRARPGP